LFFIITLNEIYESPETFVSVYWSLGHFNWSAQRHGCWSGSMATRFQETAGQSVMLTLTFNAVSTFLSKCAIDLGDKI